MNKPPSSKHRSKGDLPIKICAHCLKPMTWRKRWAKVWDEVKFCSERCRRENKLKN